MDDTGLSITAWHLREPDPERAGISDGDIAAAQRIVAAHWRTNTGWCAACTGVAWSQCAVRLAAQRALRGQR